MTALKWKVKIGLAALVLITYSCKNLFPFTTEDNTKSHEFSGGLVCLATSCNKGGTPTGTGTSTISLTSITYNGSPYILNEGGAITAQTPTILPTNAIVTSCSASPALPSGLILSNVNCAISGTPSASSFATKYTISATNSSGSVTTQIAMVSCATNSKTVFISTEKFDGNLGGTAGADSKCNIAANRPNSSKTYKVDISGSFTIVSGGNYCKVETDTSKYYWSGDTAHSCSTFIYPTSYQWTSNSSGQIAFIFNATNDLQTGSCASLYHLQCVEQ